MVSQHRFYVATLLGEIDVATWSSLIGVETSTRATEKLSVQCAHELGVVRAT